MDSIAKNIYNDILEVSDIEKQKKSWLGKDDRYISSYIEVMCRFFDDNNFETFIAKDALQIGLSNKSINELKQLYKLLDNYEEGEKIDIEIINDKGWHKIVEQAKLVIEKWDSDLKLY